MQKKKSELEQINELFSEIDSNRNNLMELNMVQLKSTGYSNVKFDTDGTQNDEVNKALLDDIDRAAKSVGIVATITTAKTGHNKYTKGSNNVSRHMNGTGVDVAILNGLGSGGATNGSNGNAQFRELGHKLAKALESIGYTRNTERGQDKAVLWQTNTGGNHFNHLHISNRTGMPSQGNVEDIETTGEPDDSSSSTSSKATVTSTSTSGSQSDTSSKSTSVDGIDISNPEVSTDVDALVKSLTQKNKSTLSSHADTSMSDIISKLLPIGEGSIYSDFGKDSQIKFDSMFIPKSSSGKIYSPVDGKIISFKYNSSCPEQMCISHDVDGETFVLEYCGISQKNVRTSDSISKGTLLGIAAGDVMVNLYNFYGRKQFIGDFIKKETTTPTEKKSDKGTKTKNSKKSKSEPKTNDSNFSGSNYKPRKSPNRSKRADGFFDILFDLPSMLFGKGKLQSITSKNQKDSGKSLNDFSITKSLKEELERMKKLL